MFVALRALEPVLDEEERRIRRTFDRKELEKNVKAVLPAARSAEVSLRIPKAKAIVATTAIPIAIPIATAIPIPIPTPMGTPPDLQPTA
ncbi:MAG: hypothetical protein KA419_21045 [Acidobacteria bacterium]|nr:hypothetical protein [Acidobacteriota bacterium]